MIRRWLRARWTLGLALCLNLLRRPFRRHGPAVWIGQLRREQLGPTDPEAWAAMGPASRCIGCGLCDMVVPPDLHPSEIIRGAVRQPADAPLALAQAAQLRAFAPQIARVCPTQVDPLAVALLIEAHARSLRPQLAAGTSAPPTPLPTSLAPPPLPPAAGRS